MIIKLAIVFFFFTTLILLLRKGLLNVDWSLPWFLALVLLAVLSTSRPFIQGMATIFGVKYPPIVIILVALFIFLGIVTMLGIYVTQLRRRQILIVRKLAASDLREQERRMYTQMSGARTQRIDETIGES
ncbi:MAG: DUF2304 family protein [Pseudomonadota bacterium]|nr:MAG: DUF2304 family protein [Pseudomonadota bacterium]